MDGLVGQESEFLKHTGTEEAHKYANANRGEREGDEAKNNLKGSAAREFCVIRYLSYFNQGKCR